MYARTTGQKGDGANGKRIVQEGHWAKKDMTMSGEGGKVKCKEGGVRGFGQYEMEKLYKAG